MTSIPTLLYAWARPNARTSHPSQTVHQNFEQTWVTDAPLNQEAQTQDCRNIGNRHGAADIAKNIAPSQTAPHKASAFIPAFSRGSIVYYGLDGVSHTLANQVLCASASATLKPLRVKAAKGYTLSCFFFQTYGLNRPGWSHIVSENLSGLRLAEDDFIPLMKAGIPADKQAMLLEIRKDLQADIRGLREEAQGQTGYDYFPQLFKLSLKYLSLAELRLGTPLFEQFFSKTASRDVSWLHPEGELSPRALQALKTAA